MKYCLIGGKLGHSYSELLHRFYGLDYSLKEISEEDLHAFAGCGSVDGFNVTIPYKKRIIDELDEVSPLAKRLGAVNTVTVKKGKKCGYNTDYFGFSYTLERHGVDVKGKNVIVLGNGGAAAVAITALEDSGATVTVASRKGDVKTEDCYRFSDARVIVNATPVGMFPNVDERIIDLSRFKRLEFVFDLVYNPFRTPLLTQADALGVNYANGLEMLVAQALASQELWAGEKFSEERFYKGLSFLKKETIPLALVGMPAAGKTTIGVALAKALGKPFYDTDDLVFKISGKTSEEIIKSRGEEAFRDIEEGAVKTALGNCGSVVALGGGAVTRENNIRLLKQTAFTVYIKRPLSALTDESRPLSKTYGVQAIFERRSPLYERAADLCFTNDGSIDEIVERIKESYENFCRERP